MPTVDISAQREQLLTQKELLAQLPPDLLEIIRDGRTPARFLDAIATAALIPNITGLVFTHFETEISEICAKWLIRPRDQGQEDSIIAAFARILPFAPYLSVFLERYIRETSYRLGSESHPFGINSLNTRPTENFLIDDLQRILFAFWRLLNFDKKTFSQLVPPSRIQELFKHAKRRVGTP